MPLVLTFTLCLISIGAGICVALQQVLNANLRAQLASPWWAGFISYFVGMVVMLLIAIPADGLRSPAALIGRIHGFVWTGGLFGAIFIGIAILDGAPSRGGDDARFHHRGPARRSGRDRPLRFARRDAAPPQPGPRHRRRPAALGSRSGSLLNALGFAAARLIAQKSSSARPAITSPLGTAWKAPGWTTYWRSGVRIMPFMAWKP